MTGDASEGEREGRFLGWSPAAHNGIKVRPAPAAEPEAFAAELGEHVHRWAGEKRNAVWLSLDVNQVHLSKVAHDLGFEFHNAKGRHAEMVKWLPSHVPNKVPPFGFTQVGVGALVLSPDNEILLVKERHRRINRWKMPGGLIDPGETLGEGVEREVREETGVCAEFRSVLAFWQRTLDANQSDIYFVCRLTVEDKRDMVIDFDPHEISECTWMPLADYVAKESHPMLLAVLKKNFGVTHPDQLGALTAGEPLLPEFELALTSLRVSPTIDPFETFLARNPRRRSGSGA